MFVILNPSPVILSPARVILSEAKDIGLLRGIVSAKDLGFRLRVNSVKNLRERTSYKKDGVEGGFYRGISESISFF
jgi:hypothetical protein